VSDPQATSSTTREGFIAYRYTVLVLALLVLLVAVPLLEDRGRLFVPLALLAVMGAVLRSLSPTRTVFRVCLLVGLTGFACQIAGRYLLGSGHAATAVNAAGLGAYTVFFGICIAAFMTKIFSERVVTGDTIRGGIAVYFLMGILWAMFYQFVILIDPDAIGLPGHTGQFSELIYFSFTTITTLGYGDISPKTFMTRNLTILESSLGQIYLTVLIARLVGLHLSGKDS
jgi:hypothetical protein